MNDPQISLEEARRRSHEKRQRFGEAAEALKVRVESEAEQLKEVAEQAQEVFEIADEAVKRYRWIAIGAALAFGVAIGNRAARRRKRERLLEDGERALVLTKAPTKPTILSSVIGTLGGILLREAANRVARAFDDLENRS